MSVFISAYKHFRGSKRSSAIRHEHALPAHLEPCWLPEICCAYDHKLPAVNIYFREGVMRLDSGPPDWQSKGSSRPSCPQDHSMLTARLAGEAARSIDDGSSGNDGPAKVSQELCDCYSTQEFLPGHLPSRHNHRLDRTEENAAQPLQHRITDNQDCKHPLSADEEFLSRADVPCSGSYQHQNKAHVSSEPHADPRFPQDSNDTVLRSTSDLLSGCFIQQREGQTVSKSSSITSTILCAAAGQISWKSTAAAAVADSSVTAEGPSFRDLPPEVVEAILEHAGPRTTCSAASASRALHQVRVQERYVELQAV